MSKNAQKIAVPLISVLLGFLLGAIIMVIFGYDPIWGFRVIIVIEANSYVNTRSSRLLPKFKTQKINSWCAA